MSYKKDLIKTIAVSGKIDDSFVGIKIDGSQIEIYHPEQYPLNIDSPSFRDDVLDLIGSIGLAKTITSAESEIFDSFGLKDDFSFYSYIWIIRDYIDHGLPTFYDKKSKPNHPGKINWKKTLSQSPLRIVDSDSVYFEKIFSDYCDREYTVITQIYQYCLKKSLNVLGWLFKIKSDIIDCPEYSETERNRFKKILQMMIHREFDDEKRLFYKRLYSIIGDIASEDRRGIRTYGVSTYYYVYESMIDNVFGNVQDISRYYPSGSWYLCRDDFNEHSIKPLREDTVHIESDRAYVIDAKYYRFGFTKQLEDLPKTSSINKQITYAKHIKNHVCQEPGPNEGKPFDKVYNIFILPFNKERYETSLREVSFSDDDLLYIGKASIEQGPSRHEYDQVYTILFDLSYTIHNWRKMKRVDKAKDLVGLIDKIVSKSV